jgi:4'-phosphopantetheinyl transferase
MSRVSDVREERQCVAKLDPAARTHDHRQFFSAPQCIHGQVADFAAAWTRALLGARWGARLRAGRRRQQFRVEGLMRFLEADEVFKRCRDVAPASGALQVWPLKLEGDANARARCEGVLSEDEAQRAARFFHEHHRAWFVFSHGLMRHILAAHCAVDAAALQLAAGERGKPFISSACQPRAARVSFNLSHSNGRALLVVADGREVGIDIEAANSRTDVLAIAGSYFCGPELAAIREAPPGRARDTFFRYWTAKEAVLKAQGCGLGVPLDSFCIVFGPASEPAAVETANGSQIDQRWRVRVLAMEDGWHAAVAAGGDGWALEVAGAG